MGKYERYSQEARRAIANAREEAQRLRHRLIGSEHLLLGILRIQATLIEGLFASLHVSTASISQALDFVVGRGNKAILSEPSLNVAVRAVLARAEELAAEEQAEVVGLDHLFLAILEEQNSVSLGVLESFGIQLAATREKLASLRNGGYERLVLSTQYHALYEVTPVLNAVCRDLTLAALNDAIDPLVGREDELERVMQILARRTKNNPVLIGPAGVGKTAIAEGLALRIIQKKVPDHLLFCRVVSLDIGLLSIGTKFRGDLEDRLKRILQEIRTHRGIIVFIDELHVLAQAGVVEGSVDIANLFKPVLARGEFQCIGATTFDEYRRTIEADPALERRFQPVMVSETSFEETVYILRGLRSRYEAFHHLAISDEAICAAVKLSSQYISSRFQPDKALDLLDEAAARLCVQRSIFPYEIQQIRDTLLAVQQAKDTAIVQHDFLHAAHLLWRERHIRQTLWQAEQTWRAHNENHMPIVDARHIAEIVAMWTGIPVVRLEREERLRLLHLEDELNQRVIGQHEATATVARAIRRSRTNIRDARRPIGSFVFIGPTGVGKTELARSLAFVLFGSEDAMLKLDMSEFMESHHASRLVSAPPGYIGYDHGGQLTESVRKQPYSVILFDEIEKAHPRIFDLLLQILEDGCLTDAHGQTVDFANTIIIMTSNTGSEYVGSGCMAFSTQGSEQSLAQATYQRMRDLMLQGLKELFHPELFNRIDDVIVFRPLQQHHLRTIVDHMIAGTQKRLAEKSIELQVTDVVRSMLVQDGFSHEYGARPLRRTVQHLLDDRLAEALLCGTISVGDTVIVDVVDGTIQLCVKMYVSSGVAVTIDSSDHAAA